MKKTQLLAVVLAATSFTPIASFAVDCPAHPQLKVTAINATTSPLFAVAEAPDTNGSNGALVASEKKVTLLPNWDPGSPTTFTLYGLVFDATGGGQTLAQCSAVITLTRACPPATPVAKLRITGIPGQAVRCTVTPL